MQLAKHISMDQHVEIYVLIMSHVTEVAGLNLAVNICAFLNWGIVDLQYRDSGIEQSYSDIYIYLYFSYSFPLYLITRY